MRANELNIILHVQLGESFDEPIDPYIIICPLTTCHASLLLIDSILLLNMENNKSYVVSMNSFVAFVIMVSHFVYLYSYLYLYIREFH